MLTPKSSVFGLAWPAFPDAKAARVLALSFQLEQTQWWDPDDLRRMQLEQVTELLVHAQRAVPHYGRLFERIRLRPRAGPLTMERFREIPLLSRDMLQSLGDKIRATSIPPEHGRTWAVQTSGSTGKPVVSMHTEVTEAIYSALSLRALTWSQCDLTQKMSMIRLVPDAAYAPPPRGRQLPTWGARTADLVPTGPASVLSVHASHAEQKDWLLREDPTYLLTYPTNLHGLARVFREDGTRPGRLREILTMGEVVTAETRRVAREVFGAPLRDRYSSREMGLAAAQCPEHEHHHVAAESVLLEVVDEHGQPCRPGEVGRIVVTPLHNFATPLVRYDIGDFAEVGEPCSCGRGLPVLRSIRGRARNMVTHPDGSTFWPQIALLAINEIVPCRQYQLVQTDLETIEARLVPEGPVTREQRESLTRKLQEGLGYPFHIELVVVGQIPRSKGGKYEDFMSLLPGLGGQG